MIPRKPKRCAKPSAITNISITFSISPEISDAEYDALMRQLQRIELEHPDLVVARFADAARREASRAKDSRKSLTAHPC